MARVLGVEGRGNLAGILLWPNFFAAISIMGVNIALARRVGRGMKSADSVSAAVCLGCLTGVVGVISCWLFLPYLLPDGSPRLVLYSRWFSLFIILNHLALNLLAIDQGRGDYQLLNISRSLLYPVYLVGIVVVWIWAENRLFGILIALLFANGLVVTVQLVSKRKLFGRANGRKKQWRDLLREGWPYQLTTIVTLFHQYMDQVLLLWLLGPASLGLYMVAKAVSSVVSSLTASLEIVSFAEAVKMRREDGLIPLATMFRRGTLLSVLMGGLLAPWIHILVPLIYGSAFQGAVGATMILLIGAGLTGNSSVIDQALRGYGLPFWGVWARSSGSAVFFVLGFCIAKQHGIIGITSAYVMSQCVLLTVFLVGAKRAFPGARIVDFVPSVSDVVFLWQWSKDSLRQKGLGG